MEQPSYYAILTASVRYDNRLTDSEKILYAEITALSNKYGYCSASNNYFAKLYEVSKRTISTRINNLKKLNYLKIELELNGKEVKKRKMYPMTHTSIPIEDNFHRGVENMVHTPIEANFQENITSNNITRLNNTSSSSASTTKQQPPSHSYSNVFNFYQENGFGILQPFVIDQINAWIDDFNGNENIVIEALKEAATNNVCKWSYANSILKSWYQDGIKSIDDIEARRKQREASKNKVQQPPKDTDDDWLNSPERQQYL